MMRKMRKNRLFSSSSRKKEICKRQNSRDANVRDVASGLHTHKNTLFTLKKWSEYNILWKQYHWKCLFNSQEMPSEENIHFSKIRAPVEFLQQPNRFASSPLLLHLNIIFSEDSRIYRFPPKSESVKHKYGWWEVESGFSACAVCSWNIQSISRTLVFQLLFFRFLFLNKNSISLKISI